MSLYQFKASYNQGQVGAKMNIALVCQNVPIGSKVGFVACNIDGPTPPFHLLDTEVSTGPNFIVSIQSVIPANYETDVIYYAFLNGEPSPDMKMSIEASIAAPSEVKIVSTSSFKVGEY